MSLTEIEYGSLASSAVLNGNFNFLQDKITELSSLITSETSSYSSTVATLNKSINDLLAMKESFIPTGCIILSQVSTVPKGFLLCDGSEVKIEDYEDLYDVIGTTYGQTDSTTFCLPDLKDKTVWGKGSKALGASIEAGLPNITGSVGISLNTWSGTGAFYNSGTGNMIGGSGIWGSNSNLINIDASRCSSIYGKSTTVQPPALVTNFIIKY